MTGYLDYTDVRNPVWADAGHSSIACEVKFDLFADYVPFIAMLSDPHPHGAEIFSACASGQYGELGDYVPPPLPSNAVTL
ncbi:hypothetical protein [Paraburkholderia susongensis]|uniref:Uncharacterized protein n=1 Tax=Paraburkholderia susongensis TaxID=1515439 RepID=A0A1X7M5J0_9BURK|nr:hypothetical protein [Paraburkholderia susongensis]SMG61301.1 hypothetical protein SAMN06265784_12083 [Paraburkholderia susongensis]